MISNGSITTYINYQHKVLPLDVEMLLVSYDHCLQDHVLREPFLNYLRNRLLFSQNFSIYAGWTPSVGPASGI